AQRIAAAATVISGQQCTAARRVLVHAARYDEMKRALKHALGSIVVAPGDTPGAGMGPLIDAQALEQVAGAAERAFDICDEVVLERFEDEKDAVARANHTVFGLSASVWTLDGDRGMRVARALRNGTVWINDHNRLFAEAETGGYRRSGVGRLHGYEGLNDFLETKHIYRSVGLV
ncbi:MAG: aldehyde dehydrogenase family protein, partial [Oxalobacteraceae bacterium]